MIYRILVKMRDGSKPDALVAGEVFNHKEDADYLACLLQEHSRTANYVTVEVEEG